MQEVKKAIDAQVRKMTLRSSSEIGSFLEILGALPSRDAIWDWKDRLASIAGCGLHEKISRAPWYALFMRSCSHSSIGELIICFR